LPFCEHEKVLLSRVFEGCGVEGVRIAQQGLQICVDDHPSRLRKKGAIEIINIDESGLGPTFG